MTVQHVVGKEKTAWVQVGGRWYTGEVFNVLRARPENLVVLKVPVPLSGSPNFTRVRKGMSGSPVEVDGKVIGLLTGFKRGYIIVTPTDQVIPCD